MDVQPQVKTWKPNSRKQEFLLSLPDSVFEALYGGAAGGGKSELLMMIPIARGFINNPRFKGIFLRRTYSELEKEIIPRSKEYYPATGGVYNEQKKVYTWPSGALMFFGHIEHEQDVRKYDTSEFQYVAFDELTSFTKFQYMYLTVTRCRAPKNSGLPAIVRNGTNPGNVGHGWVRDYFKVEEVEPQTIMKQKLPDGSSVMRVFVQAFVTDNPDCDPGYGSRLEMLRAISEAEYQAKKFGRWDLFEGQVFDDFRVEHLFNEPANACHVIDPPKIEDYYPIVLAVDWGYTAMTYACWGAVLPNRRFVIFKEFACKKEKISFWASEIGRISAELGDIVDVVLCQSAFAQRGDEKTIAQQFEEHSGLSPRKADNDRIGGKLLLQDFLRWKPKPVHFNAPASYDAEYAARTLRVQGLEAHDKYLASFKEPEPETNLPRLQISRACPVLIRTIPLCVYDDKNKEDVKEFDGDDPYDAGRYFCKAVDYYVNRVEREMSKREAIANIIVQQQSQPDMNRFYMRMRLHESKNKPHNAVKRFHV